MALQIALRAASLAKASSPLILRASPLALQVSKLGSCQSSILANAQKFQAVRMSTSIQAQNLRRNLSTSMYKRAAAAGNASHGNHSKLWSIERILSAGLLVALPGTVLMPSQPLDLVVALGIVMHSYWGLEAIVVDYARPIVIGNTLPKVAHGFLIVFCAATLAGLVYFIQNDVGIGQGIRNLWSIKGYVEPPPPPPKGKK